MYHNIYYSRRDNTIHIWDDTEGYVYFEYPRYAYRKKAGGEYRSIYGEELEKIAAYRDDDPSLYESDVRAEMRVLIDAYEESDEPSEGAKVGYIDIEVSSEGGFPNIETGDKEITAITMYDQPTDKYYTYILDKEEKIEPVDTKDRWVKPYRDEKTMLMAFINKWEEFGWHIVSGWNTDYFDLPYLFARMSVVIGVPQAKRLSPIGICYLHKFFKKMVIAGVSSLDYLYLYKKFRGEMQPSYSLNYVTKTELGVGKVAYRGSLDKLYREDIQKFLEYNIFDVQLVVELDKKFDYIYLARSLAHIGHVPYEWYHMSSRWIDGAILMYLRRHNLVAPNCPIGGREEYEKLNSERQEGFKGAFVKEPVPGRYPWVYSADITSLYPSTIMSINISPETKFGKVENWNWDDFERGKLPYVQIEDRTYTPEEFKRFIKENRLSVAANGALYEKDKEGVIPILLDKWFSERVEYRQKAKEYGEAGDKEKESYYDRRQKVQKIFLNSVYGTLGLPIFRFYDRDNAEATTLSGQTIIKTTEKYVNMLYKERFDKHNKVCEDKDFVIYIDTDSVYMSSAPIAELEGIDMSDDEKMTQFTIDLSKDVASRINNFYKVAVDRLFYLDNHRIKITEDVIASAAFWRKKKRYAMFKVYDMEKSRPVKDKDGNIGKIETKGFDVVRSSFPARFRKIMEKTLELILKGTPKDELDDLILDFEQELETLDLEEIAKITSVNFISGNGVTNYNPDGRSKFQIPEPRTPAGVRAAFYYNDLMKHWGLESFYEPIKNREKIKWVYLKINQFGLKQIAFKGEDMDAPQMMEFINLHVDRQKMYVKELRGKLEVYFKIMGWNYSSASARLVENFIEFE